MMLKSLEYFPQFFGNLLICASLLSLFAAVYIRITPHKEIDEIRKGNTSAAIAFGGALLGYTIAVGSAITHSANVYDLVIWGVLAAGVQFGAIIISNKVLPGEFRDIGQNKPAPAVFLATLSLCVGIINAHSMIG